MHVDQDSEAALTRIPGIGKKTAQRLLIELKDKLKDIEVDSSDLDMSVPLHNTKTVTQRPS